jgi:hypothetical protein
VVLFEKRISVLQPCSDAAKDFEKYVDYADGLGNCQYNRDVYDHDDIGWGGRKAVTSRWKQSFCTMLQLRTGSRKSIVF